MLDLGNFHWLNLASNMVTREGEFHRRQEGSPFKRDIQGEANSLSKLVIWREDNLPNILLEVMRIPWARATGSMKREFFLNMGGRVDDVVLLDSRFMGELGMVLSSTSKGEAF